MNYLKLMSILSEKDASEYKIKKNTKKDDRDDYERSKADKAFKDLHKVDVTSEDELDSPGYKVTTKHVGDHKGNPSATNTFDGPMKHNSELKKFDKGGFGKSSYRPIDKKVGNKTFDKVKEEVEDIGEASKSINRAEFEKSQKEAQKNIDTFRTARKTKAKAAAGARIGTGLYYEPDKRSGPKAYGEATEAGHKVGAKVVAKKGPHKGQVHTVIHKYDGENKYNIKPDVRASANRYPQGAASASGAHLMAHAGRSKG